MGLPILKEIAPRECENSVNITKALSKQIVGRQYKTAETQSTIELKIQANREQSHIMKLDQISERMTDNKKNPTDLIKDLNHITPYLDTFHAVTITLKNARWYGFVFPVFGPKKLRIWTLSTLCIFNPYALRA